LTLPVEKVGIGDRNLVSRGVPLREVDQPVGLDVGEGSQECRVDNAEYRGVGANAQSQGEHYDGGEGGVLPQLANCKSKVFHSHFA
jgi:hypothetical protein